MKKSPDKAVSYKRIAKEFINKHLSQNEEDPPDRVDELGLQTLEKDGEHTRLQTELLRSRVHRYKQDTALRELYARRVYRFMLAYTFFMAAIVLFSSLPESANAWGLPLKLDIEDVPLATLIGGAFASAVGLVAFVIKGLFPHDRQLDRSHTLLQLSRPDEK